MAFLASFPLANRLVRHYSGKCDDGKPESTCGLVLNEYTCGLKPTEPYASKKYSAKPKFVSMWALKDCERSPCVMDLRYDMKYYSISDKKKRKYQVTWNECPRLLIKPKKVCLYEKIKQPKIERRVRPSLSGRRPLVPKTVTALPKTACVYVKSVCCKTGRLPPTCKTIASSPGKCEKRKAPYPSYSECLKDPTIPPPPVECNCISNVYTCDAWATLRRRLLLGKPPAKVCGEA